MANIQLSDGKTDFQPHAKRHSVFSYLLSLIRRFGLYLVLFLLFSLAFVIGISFTSSSSTLSLRPWRSALLSESSIEYVLPSWAHGAASVLVARSMPSVVLRQGVVTGTIIDDATLPKQLEAFLGIPYALPPTGNRRFARPEPVKTSNATIDASSYGPRYASCLSISLYTY